MSQHSHDPTTEMEKNWVAFKAREESLKAENLGRTVLLHDGEIVQIYNDSGDAYSIGCEKFGLGKFSIQTIGEKPRSLGILTMHIGS
ncbi:MAG: hypothetical protein OXN89_14825 [Bryobacterales bacterium]|nr:hypothetical protein [Bryobacterales bacterium]